MDNTATGGLSSPVSSVKASIFILTTLMGLGSICLPLRSLAQTQPANPSNSPEPPSESQPDKSVVYVNKQYGFRFYLPKSWKGYSILVDQWKGSQVGNERADAPAQPESGPKISIRHPLWSSNDPRQDIPIMIFTPAQWKLIQNEKLSVSAAPIGPSELGHNAKYVFALPARYNFAFPTGYAEAEKIIASHPLHTF
jgi:hypothetical protein